MAQALLQPIFETDPASPHFFHGRLLSAEDLRAEQKFHALCRHRLGRAVGDGVVEGLEVDRTPQGSTTAGQPTLRVRAGVAVNRRGHVLALADAADLALVPSAGAAAASASGLFDDCRPPSTDQLASGPGFYVLALSPAEGLSAERVPQSSLASEGRVEGCGSRSRLAGVRFRLVELRLEELQDTYPASVAEILELDDATADAERSRRRNLVAHLFFGTEKLAGFAADPFKLAPSTSRSSDHVTAGALDEMRAAGRLSDCDVPLALLEWTEDGLGDVDLWAVRRRALPLPPSALWPTLAGTRSPAVAEAAFLQFQAHLDELFRGGLDGRSFRAGNSFSYLPPAGLLPLTRRVTAETFFTAHPFRRPIELLDGQRLPALVRRSFTHPPIKVDEEELVWLYRPWQNARNQSASPYVVFTSLHMPHAVLARYNAARYEASNYARPGDVNS